MSFRNLILHNFWLKLSSVALATVIWLAIHYSIHSDLGRIVPVYIRVPVTIKTAPGDKRLFRVTPPDAVVIAVGDDAALRRAARKDIRVNIDLTDFNSREPVSKDLKAEVPLDIYVLEISPTNATVQQISP